MQIISLGDSLHEMAKPIFWRKQKYFTMSSTDIITQHAMC